MANERVGYEQQTTPRAAAAMPLANPGTYGAGAGEAASQLGATLHAGQVQAYQLERKRTADQEAAKWSHDFTVHRGDLDELERDRRTAGGENYTSDVMRANEAAKDKMLAGITEDGVRRQAMAQWDHYSEGLRSRASDWEEGQRVAGVALARGNALKTATGRVYRDPSKWQEELTLQLAANASLNVEPDVHAKLDHATDIELGSARLDSMSQTDPLQAKIDMAGGAFDFLGADALDGFNAKAESELRSRMVAARTEAVAAKSEFNAASALAIKQVNDGVPADDAALAQMEQQATALGLADRVYELGQAREINRVSGEYRSATPELIADDLAELDGEISRQGDKVAPKLVNRRAALAKVLTARRGEVASDPLAVGAKAGIAIADIDWAAPDPAAIEQRRTAAHAVSEMLGRPVVILRPDEAATMKAEMASGRAGRMRVLTQLDAIGDGFDKAAAARQIAPEDRAFQHLAQIRPEHRTTVISGQEALTANPAMLKPSKEDPRGVAGALAKVDAELAFALRSLSPEDAAAVQLTAQEYMAGQMAGLGRTVDTINEADYRRAMRVALGGGRRGTTSIGGLGHWSAGQAFIVPDGFSLQGFALGMRRDRLRQEAAGGGPVDSDGKTPFNLNQAWPVMIAPGRYRWETRVGTIKDRKGGNYISTVEAGQ